jgi:glycosyltransferase involved in cell wall biosynthesis
MSQENQAEVVDSLGSKPVPLDLHTPEHLGTSDWPAYPVLLPLHPASSLDSAGVPFHVSDAGESGYQPTTIAEHGLAEWNTFLAGNDPAHRDAFLAQAAWILARLTPLQEGEERLPGSPATQANAGSGPWLSGRAAGAIVSLLTRAYRVTGDPRYLTGARRAAQVCERDILDGGVASVPGMDGVFFEDEALYPATHTLLAHLQSLVGLYDYTDLAQDPTHDTALDALTARGMKTLHALLDAFDTGRWTRANLLYGELAGEYEHALHVAYLAAVVSRCGCAQCTETLLRWRRYGSAAHQQNRSVMARGGKQQPNKRRSYLDASSPPQQVASRLRVCVPITAFPFPGGMRSVVRGFQQAMTDDWDIEYLAGSVGAHGPEVIIQSFGIRRSVFGASAMAPSQFPNVWRYVWRGFRALRAMLKNKLGVALILPQDGVFTGAFAAVAGHLAGIRVVVVDHGNVTLPHSKSYHQERVRGLSAMPTYRQPLEHLRLALYWPSARALRAVATKYSDHFLAAGEDVAHTWIHELGVPPWRVTIFPFLVKTHIFAPSDQATRGRLRTELGIPDDALVITMVNRLTPEKGMDIALQGLHAFLVSTGPEVRDRIRCLIVGEGPLRAQIEEQIQEFRLDPYCALLGEADEAGVARLLGLSDIFLYTGVRGINSMAVLEAMSSGCAIVASTEPHMIARYLDEGRGVAIPPRSPHAVMEALRRLADDGALRASMGRMARQYVEERHTEDALRRSLRRATMWSPVTTPLPKDSGFSGNSPQRAS